MAHRDRAGAQSSKKRARTTKKERSKTLALEEHATVGMLQAVKKKSEANRNTNQASMEYLPIEYENDDGQTAVAHIHCIDLNDSGLLPYPTLELIPLPYEDNGEEKMVYIQSIDIEDSGLLLEDN